MITITPNSRIRFKIARKGRVRAIEIVNRRTLAFLMLARALRGQPSILVLDGATSSLDTENDRLIQKAIHRLHGQLTVVVIAHRLSTVRKADSIVVLNRGEIVELGTWHLLLSRPGSLRGNGAGRCAVNGSVAHCLP